MYRLTGTEAKRLLALVGTSKADREARLVDLLVCAAKAAAYAKRALWVKAQRDAAAAAGTPRAAATQTAAEACRVAFEASEAAIKAAAKQAITAEVAADLEARRKAPARTRKPRDERRRRQIQTPLLRPWANSPSWRRPFSRRRSGRSSS